MVRGGERVLMGFFFVWRGKGRGRGRNYSVCMYGVCMYVCGMYMVWTGHRALDDRGCEERGGEA